MRYNCDLHVHSVFSDGTCTSAELIALARDAGLQAVALCDHNTVSGLPDFVSAAENSGVEGIPGIEFSTEYLGGELHILGLFLLPEHAEKVNALLQEALQRKEQSNIDLIRRLNEAGIRLDYHSIKNSMPRGSVVNRAVIAAEMVRRGYCESVKAAFKKWLDPEQGYYIPAKRLDAFEVIRFIKSIGAAAVLAHPFLNLKEEPLRVFLPKAIEAGLDGMETEYPLFDEEKRALARSIADEFGLLRSGGSDYHGANKPDIRIGQAAASGEMLELLRRRCGILSEKP